MKKKILRRFLNILTAFSRHIEVDKTDDKALLNYATVYSSPEGGSWYCMPEVGDRVIIKFPNLQSLFMITEMGKKK